MLEAQLIDSLGGKKDQALVMGKEFELGKRGKNK